MRRRCRMSRRFVAKLLAGPLPRGFSPRALDPGYRLGALGASRHSGTGLKTIPSSATRPGSRLKGKDNYAATSIVQTFDPANNIAKNPHARCPKTGGVSGRVLLQPILPACGSGIIKHPVLQAGHHRRTELSTSLIFVYVLQCRRA